jgi:hypothetical protein
MDDTDYFMIEERDIAYIIEESEEVRDKKTGQSIILPKNKVITN